MMPAAMIAATALPPFTTSSKLAMMTCAVCGFGISLTVISVTIANMPSLPISTASRSSPGASGASEPNSTTSPSIVTARTRRTLCTVRPYFRQWTPPEFSETLPPIVHAICDDGSGA